MKTFIDKDLDKFTTNKLVLRKRQRIFIRKKDIWTNKLEITWKKHMNKEIDKYVSKVE